METYGLPQKVLITSALPYANGNVHLGHLAGAYLPADIMTRWLRLKGHEVLFVCGSDEHGVPITLSARERGISPQAVADEYHNANGKAFAAAGVHFDVWGRTSSIGHHSLTKEFFLRLYKNGHIEKRRTKQLYSDKMKMFLPDRYVVGNCPACDNPNARGDQCDNCGHTYEVTELKNPRSALLDDGSTPTLKETAHWFLKLEDFSEKLSRFLDLHEENADHPWRANALREARGWLKRGLRARCITRDTEWGVNIPLEDPDTAAKRLYVWFDAPIGYVTFTKQLLATKGDPEGWKDWWQNPDCAILNFIGKDNIPFHAITWPAMLLGVNEDLPPGERPYVTPAQVVANEFLNFGADKFSKSRGNVIRIDDFVAEYGTDALRYHLTATAPEGNDSEFTWEDFRHRYNGEAADVIGNFIHRAFVFTRKTFGGKIPEGSPPGALENELRAALAKMKSDCAAELYRFRFKSALSAILETGRACNRYIDQKAPWTQKKSDLPGCGTTMRLCLEAAAAMALALRPFLPHSAERLLGVFGRQNVHAPGSADLEPTDIVAPGAFLGEPEIVFKKLDDPEKKVQPGST